MSLLFLHIVLKYIHRLVSNDTTFEWDILDIFDVADSHRYY